MSDTIVNKIAESGLITLDPADFLPREPIQVFDLKDYLFMGMILKEKDFREKLKTMDWEPWRGSIVGLTCTADAIIPVWAYMLVTTYLQGIATEVLMGDEASARRQLLQRALWQWDITPYHDKRVVIKGCGDDAIEEFVYTDITRKLLPVVKSVMYGEPCSTVPVYKKK
ncbi:MAG: DUF2480 family protein [Chitinophagaceae bacterium]|nr:DUF2480 family protein [Chitinophagaceae bacterium]